MEEAKRRLKLAFETIETYLQVLSRQNDVGYRTAEIEAKSALVNTIFAIYEAQYIVGIIKAADIAAISRRYQILLNDARNVIAASREVMERRLDESLAAKVGAYTSVDWIEAIREGLPHELWYVLNERDKIEAMIQVPVFLLKDLSLRKDLDEDIRRADQALRDFGAELWGIDQPTGVPPQERHLFIPPTHWWWWLDTND